MRAMAGVLPILLAALGAAAEEPIDGWLPEGTLFCLSVEDPTRTAARLAEGRYAELRGDPAAQRTLVLGKDLLSSAREASHARGEAWLGPFWRLARGRILLAVIRAGGRETPLVVMDTGSEESFPRYLARLADAGVLGGVVERGDGILARPAGEGAGGVYWTHRDGVVAFSWRPEAVEAVAQGPRARDASLAPRLAAARARLRADADALVLLPREALAELERGNPDLRALALGPDAHAALAITLDPDALDVRAFLHAERPRAGLLAFLDEPNADFAAPPFAHTFVAARLDLPRILELAGVTGDETPLVKPFVHALGRRFALARAGGEEVFVAEVRREGFLRRVLSTLPDAGGGVRMGPDGAVAIRDGWLLAGRDPAAVMRMLAAPEEEAAPEDALPRERLLFWRIAPGAPRDWDDPMRLFASHEGALVNDADGLLLIHRARLR